MAAKKDSGNRIIKPLAAAFLVTAPEKDELEEKKKTAAKPAARPAAEIKTGELSKEETRALLKEQLVNLSADEKPEEKAEEKPKEEQKPAAPKKAAEKTEKAENSEKAADKKPEKKAEKAEAPAAEAEKPAAETEEAVTIEYGNISVSRDELVARAIKIWTSKLKRGRSELHTLELYVKPQERKAYYVFNKKKNGDFDL